MSRHPRSFIEPRVGDMRYIASPPLAPFPEQMIQLTDAQRVKVSASVRNGSATILIERQRRRGNEEYGTVHHFEIARHRARAIGEAIITICDAEGE